MLFQWGWGVAVLAGATGAGPVEMEQCSHMSASPRDPTEQRDKGLDLTLAQKWNDKCPAGQGESLNSVGSAGETAELMDAAHHTAPNEIRASSTSRIAPLLSLLHHLI